MSMCEFYFNSNENRYKNRANHLSLNYTINPQEGPHHLPAQPVLINSLKTR
jgi:hypothetical protein